MSIVNKARADLNDAFGTFTGKTLRLLNQKMKPVCVSFQLCRVASVP